MKTIIIFSTKYGSVEKAAHKLHEYLEGETEVVNVKNSPDFSGYDNVILGGSLYAGHIQKEMRRFVREHLSQLKEKRIGLFLCAGTDKEDVINNSLKINFTPELYEIAVARDNFGYEYHYDRLSFFEKIIVRLVGGIKESRSLFYDGKISEFARKIEEA